MEGFLSNMEDIFKMEKVKKCISHDQFLEKPAIQRTSANKELNDEMKVEE